MDNRKQQEASDLNAMVVNARHMKAVPGRKTDVKDAEWIADLLQHGLLQPSYIPDKDQRELRELVRYRKSPVGERTRELNSLQKMLEGANIKLSGRMRISAHRGNKRVYVAVAHSMLIAIYHILKDGVVFKELGAEYYNQFNKEKPTIKARIGGVL